MSSSCREDTVYTLTASNAEGPATAAHKIIVRGLPGVDHRWSFNETQGETTLADSVGGADATIKILGATDDHTLTGTAIRLTGGARDTSDYVEMPGGLLAGRGNVTIEAWAAPHSFPAWGRVFSFNSGINEIRAMDFAFSRGQDGNTQRLAMEGISADADANLATNENQQYHYAVVWEDAEHSPPNGRVSWYRDGALAASVSAEDLTPDDMEDTVLWLGRSAWAADSTGNATWEEFRIYDGAMTAAQVAESRAAGPDTLPGGPVINSFYAFNPAIYEGSSTALGWNVFDPNGGAGVTLAIDNGVGAVSPLVGTSGSVSPVATTTYTLTASSPGSPDKTATATVTVDPGVPAAASQSVATDEGVAAGITLAGSDPNMHPNASLAYAVETGPSGGALSGTAPDLTYTPNPGFTGQDSFTFTVNDGKYTSAEATVSITVWAAPAAPTGIALGSTQVPSSSAIGSALLTLASADINPQNTHTYELVAGEGDADNALFAISGDRLFAVGDLSGMAGSTVSIRLRTTDDTGLSYEEAFQLTVVASGTGVVINEVHFDGIDTTVKE
ncbi:MAG: LamG-like jellyroll fold domain-containing protein, partial [Verrucomicrobiales bacterium]